MSARQAFVFVPKNREIFGSSNSDAFSIFEEFSFEEFFDVYFSLICTSSLSAHRCRTRRRRATRHCS
jgi:hypothetical protein